MERAKKTHPYNYRYHVAKHELKRLRGWTDRMISDFLTEEDDIGNESWGNHSVLYIADRVARVEQTQEFKDQMALLNQKREKRKLSKEAKGL